MKNTLQDLNNYLFESIERINDDSLSEEEFDREIKRSEATNKVATTIISNAELQLRALKYADTYGYNEAGKNVISSILPQLEAKKENV